MPKFPKFKAGDLVRVRIRRWDMDLRDTPSLVLDVSGNDVMLLLPNDEVEWIFASWVQLVQEG